MEIIEFEKNKSLFNKTLSLGIAITSDLDNLTLRAIKNDEKIEDINLPFTIGEGKVVASGDKKTFQFKGEAEVSIDGSADGHLRIGVFRSIKELAGDLLSHDKINIEIDEQTDDNSVYVLFSMGYSLSAEAKGSWVLSGGSLEAGISGDSAKRMAILRRYDKSTGLRTAIKETISELRSPKQIKKVDEVSPGTYMVLQSSGAVSGSFGAMAGHQFNWVYESKHPGLTGSVGLEAKLGAKIGIGFEYQGDYAMVLSREDDDEELRVKLFKQRHNGWNFAASISASLKGELDDNFKKTSLDDLIKATIGVHHTQVIDDIRKKMELLDQEKLEEKLHGYTDKLLKKLADSTNVDETLETWKSKILDLIEKWEALGEKASSALWKILDEKAKGLIDVDVSELKEHLKLIASSDQAEVQKYLEDQLAKIDYLETPVGQLLLSILPKEDIISAVTERDEFAMLQDKARSLVDLLDLESHVLKFHKTISDELKLDKIKKAVNSADFDALGDWLKDQLSELIAGEEGQFVMEKLKEVNDFINNVREKSKEIFEKTKKAMQSEYGFSLAYNYQKIKDTSALIDASFDLSKSGVSTVFKNTLKGDYNDLLVKPKKGIVLHEGMLTHRIKREKSIALSLPFMKRDFKHINNSIATGKFIDEDNGRLVMYEVDAQDIRRKSRRMSQLAFEGYYKELIGENKVEQVDESIKISYNFKIAHKKFRTKHLEQVVEPFIKKYLPEEFNTDQMSTNKWISKMEKQIDAVNKNRRNVFGQTMLNLELRVPSAVGSAWFRAPDDPRDDEYESVSIAIQERLREVIPLYFFENEDFFQEQWASRLETILVYMSLPAVDDMKIRNNGKLKRHWDWGSSRKLKSLLNDPKIILKLGNSIGYVKAKLFHDSDPAIQKLHERFDTANVGFRDSIISNALSSNNAVNTNLRSLFAFEEKVIRNTMQAGVQLGEFVEQSHENPKQAIKGLQAFGSMVTECFNNAGVRLIASRKDYTRYIGVELFIAVAQALDPTLKLNTQGSLELLVLKESSEFDISDYLDGQIPDKEDLIIDQRILDLS